MKDMQTLTTTTGYQFVEEEVVYTDAGAVITEPFDPKKIDIQTKQMILDAIFKRMKNDEIDMHRQGACLGYVGESNGD